VTGPLTAGKKFETTGSDKEVVVAAQDRALGPQDQESKRTPSKAQEQSDAQEKQFSVM
jgi:hypothetical protein